MLLHGILELTRRSSLTIHPAPALLFDFFDPLPIVVQTSNAPLTSDAGLLPLRQFDDRIGLTAQFAAALHDPRAPDLTEHSFLTMVRMRLFGILADYEDQNDHATLRTDPVFKLLAGRSPDDADLASQPTLSRFENAIDCPSLKRLRDVFIDQFIASFAAPPRRLTFDIDAVDDPAHGAQQLVLFHGYFEQYQYFPLVISCAENDQVVSLSLRHGTAHAALGADDDLEHLVGRLRHVWPDVHIHVRGDAGCGVPWMYNVCERLGLEYTFGLAANVVLQRETADLLAEAVQRFAQTRQPQRLFAGFWYQAGTWDRPRWVIAKAEAHAPGTNRRFIVSNRPGARAWIEPTYDDYAMRGESENRNKELKRDLAVDRLSDHRFKANYFRLYLHAAALNLLVRLRQEIADPPPVPAESVPAAALVGAARQQYQRQRRQRDPLGEGQPWTWRTLLIKVAASVVVSTRRVLVLLSASWPHRDYYRRVSEHISRRPAVGHTWSG
jgi:Transposase DDE domain group 1